MATATILIVAICFVSLVSGYYSPVINNKKPIIVPHKRLPGCYAPQFKDGSYSPDLPSGFCNFGTVLHFKCKPGYNLDGPKEAECKFTGRWHPPHIPTCKKVDKCKMHNPCASNSKCVDYQGHIKCICDNGYVAKGNKCIAMTCSIPKLGKYCRYTPKYQQKWFPGQKIKYVCPPGYDLIGPQYGNCLHGGVWDKKPPVCKKRVYCKVPSLPYYCSYTPRYRLSWGYGQKIQYHCPAGFKKVGADYSTCTHGGKWDSYPPKCERPKLCDLPKLPQHCGYSPPQKRHWDVGSKIHFHCPTSYNKVGSDYATCVDHGVWDTHPPLCEKPVLCHPPVSKDCGYKPNFVSWHAGQKVAFYNPHGYKVVGHPEATCTAKGTWDNPPPKCPPPPKCCLPKLDGKVSVYQQHGYQNCWHVGQKIQFKCPYGYYLKGDDYAKCLDGGKWSAHPPVCIKKVVCYLPKLKDHCGYAPYNQKSWNAGEKIVFHCPKGYDLEGNDYALCNDYGKWSHDTPYCKKPKCCLPKLDGKVSVYQQHGYQNCWYVGQKVQFKCPYGYYLKGDDYAKCLDGGTWSAHPPVCIKKVVCYLPKLKDHCGYAPYNQKSWNAGEKIVFHCPKGYDLKGNDYALCNDYGKWSHDTPYCIKRIVCHAPTLTPHCDYQPKHKVSWYPGQKIKYYCPHGYTLDGHPYASCTHYGKWSNPAPVCKKVPVYCKAPPLPPTCHCKMSTNYKPYYNVGEMAKFTCPYGYILKGYEIAKCMYNGYWSHPTPVCIKKAPPIKYGYGYGLFKKFW